MLTWGFLGERADSSSSGCLAPFLDPLGRSGATGVAGDAVGAGEGGGGADSSDDRWLSPWQKKDGGWFCTLFGVQGARGQKTPRYGMEHGLIHAITWGFGVGTNRDVPGVI